MTVASSVLLDVNGIEVIYSHVILVLKGVSLQVPEGKVVALLGGNGAGKTTTLRAVSNLLRAERGEVTKGSIQLRGERIERLSTSDMVERGVIQVMEGRHCFAHLTIEENLLTGAYTRRDGKAAVAATLEKVYRYFPRLRDRRGSQAAYTSGGEQQMCAIGRALMANPKMVLLDEPSMGLAPQIVEEVFEIVKDLNQKEGVTFLLAEQNTNMALALRRLRLHPGKRPGRHGRRCRVAARERGRARVLPRHRLGLGRAQELPRREELQAPQALALLRRNAMARADAEALKPLALLLRQLREIKGVKEKSAGIFYGRNDAFIHFHVEDGALFADLKKPGGSGFDRYPLATPAEQRKLVEDAKLRARRFDDD